MPLNESASRLRTMIDKAIDDKKITRPEMHAIIALATEDGHIDSQERALLNQLQAMIEDKTVKYVL
jgi:uncharacterized membrane protein YebE (DUF533 family)